MADQTTRQTRQTRQLAGGSQDAILQALQREGVHAACCAADCVRRKPSEHNDRFAALAGGSSPPTQWQASTLATPLASHLCANSAACSGTPCLPRLPSLSPSLPSLRCDDAVNRLASDKAKRQQMSNTTKSWSKAGQKQETKLAPLESGRLFAARPPLPALHIHVTGGPLWHAPTAAFPSRPLFEEGGGGPKHAKKKKNQKIEPQQATSW